MLGACQGSRRVLEIHVDVYVYLYMLGRRCGHGSYVSIHTVTTNPHARIESDILVCADLQKHTYVPHCLVHSLHARITQGHTKEEELRIVVTCIVVSVGSRTSDLARYP